MYPEVEARKNMMQVDQETGEIAHLPKITAQQKVYVAALVGGLSRAESAKQAGATYKQARIWDEKPEVFAWLEHYREVQAEKVLPNVRFGKEDAHAMYMEAYHLAATAAEKIKATDSLVKLHRINDRPTEQTLTPEDIRHVKQLSDMSMEQLARLAEMEDIIEGEILGDEE